MVLLVVWAGTTAATTKHMRQHGHDHKHEHSSVFGGTNSSLQCVAKRFPCARLGDSCSRPRSIYFFKLRGTGGKMFGEGVLNHLFTREQITVCEGWSLSHPATFAKLALSEATGRNAIRITILRHPLERIISRYYFEGRWPLFERGPRTDNSATSFEDWFNKTSCSVSRGGERLWACTSNYYVKSFAGYSGKSMCSGSSSSSSMHEGKDANCVLGVGQPQLEAAKVALSQHINVILLTEWLSSRAQIAFLGHIFCFAHVAGVTPVMQHPPTSKSSSFHSEGREIPSFRSVRPAGGHSKLRPKTMKTPAAALTGKPGAISSKGFKVSNVYGYDHGLSADMLELLFQRNRLDLDMFYWAAGRALAQFPAVVAPQLISELPPLPGVTPAAAQQLVAVPYGAT